VSGPLSSPEPVVAVLARSHGLLEAPRLTPDGAALYSDVLGGGVYEVDPAGAVRQVLPDRRGIGGLVPHADGGVVVSGRTLVHVGPDGSQRELAGREGVTGYNDLHTEPDGAVLVGALRYRPLAGEPAAPGRLLRVRRPDAVEVLTEAVVWPNGIGLSPDAATVYVSDYAGGRVLALSGTGGEPDELCRSPEGSADGLAVDEEGGVWIALGEGGGLARFEPDGELDTIVDVPAGFVSSLSFGGPERRDVLITTADNLATPETGGTLFRARSDIPGLPTAPASV
jgi:sugar lactone lactonase YvrE